MPSRGTTLPAEVDAADRERGRNATPLRSTPLVGTVMGLVLVALPIANVHGVLPWTLHGVEEGGRSRWWVDMAFLVLVHVVLTGACVVAVRAQGRSLDAVGITRAGRARWLIGFAVVIVIALVGVQLRRVGVFSASGSPRPIDPHSAVERAVFAIEGLLVGVCQEVMWRGFSIPGLLSYRRVSTAVAVVLTSVSFGYYHGGFTQQPVGAFLGLTLVAVGLALLMLWRRNLWLAMFIHGTFNALSAVLA